MPKKFIKLWKIVFEYKGGSNNQYRIHKREGDGNGPEDITLPEIHFEIEKHY